jgi:Prokaryotic E2 family E
MKMRRQFTLPEGDESHMLARGLAWETIVENGVRWLLIHDFPAPGGYNHAKVLAAVKIETGYPDTQLDMVYFYPALARLDGRPIGALSSQTLDGKAWQRWSRHRTAQNPWRPGEDDLSSHLALVEHWLEREMLKG